MSQLCLSVVRNIKSSWENFLVWALIGTGAWLTVWKTTHRIVFSNTKGKPKIMSNMCYCPSEKKEKKKSGSKLSEVYSACNPTEELHWDLESSLSGPHLPGKSGLSILHWNVGSIKHSQQRHPVRAKWVSCSFKIKRSSKEGLKMEVWNEDLMGIDGKGKNTIKVFKIIRIESVY